MLNKITTILKLLMWINKNIAIKIYATQKEPQKSRKSVDV
jgi:hypothetical protein